MSEVTLVSNPPIVQSLNQLIDEMAEIRDVQPLGGRGDSRLPAVAGRRLRLPRAGFRRLAGTGSRHLDLGRAGRHPGREVIICLDGEEDVAGLDLGDRKIDGPPLRMAHSPINLRSHTRTDVSAMPVMTLEPSGVKVRADVRIGGVLSNRVSLPVAVS